MNKSQQFCTFYVDKHCFGVSVDKVQEVLRNQPMTSVPLAPREVCGLINLRGQIVTVIDLRRCLNLPDREQQGGTNVIMQTGDDIVSLLVDEMGNVEYVKESQFELPPDTMRGDQRELIMGTYKLPEKLMLVLDVERVVVSEKSGQAP
jgi:purine-binding chemotaxis protein CheW